MRTNLEESQQKWPSRCARTNRLYMHVRPRATAPCACPRPASANAEATLVFMYPATVRSPPEGGLDLLRSSQGRCERGRARGTIRLEHLRHGVGRSARAALTVAATVVHRRGHPQGLRVHLDRLERGRDQRGHHRSPGDTLVLDADWLGKRKAFRCGAGKGIKITTGADGFLIYDSSA